MSRLTGDLALALPSLTRLVLSQPADPSADPKVSIRPVTCGADASISWSAFMTTRPFRRIWRPMPCSPASSRTWTAVTVRPFW